MQNAVPARRGSGLTWSSMRSFSSEVELKDYLTELDGTAGRINIKSTYNLVLLVIFDAGTYSIRFRVQFTNLAVNY